MYLFELDVSKTLSGFFFRKQLLKSRLVLWSAPRSRVKKMSKIHKSVYPCANQPKSGGIYQSAFIRQKLTPWNVDTISHDKFAKTIINKEVPKRRDEDMSEEERAERYKNFLGKYKEKIKHFGMLKHYEDSKTFLLESPDLVCDDTANYLVVWCIDLEIEEVTFNWIIKNRISWGLVVKC